MHKIYIFARAFGAKQEKTFKFSVRGPGRGKNQVLTRGYHREKWKIFCEADFIWKNFLGCMFWSQIPTGLTPLSSRSGYGPAESQIRSSIGMYFKCRCQIWANYFSKTLNGHYTFENANGFRERYLKVFTIFSHPKASAKAQPHHHTS